MRRLRLGILATHPIQYQAPWFRALGSRPELDAQVLFCHRAGGRDQAGAGFGVEFDWDVPLLEGYSYRFLANMADRPGLGSFSGLDTPEVVRLIAQRRYDALIINGWHYKAAWQAIVACWRTGTPVLVRSDSHLHSARSSLRRWAKWLPYRAAISRFDACLSVGSWSSEYFLHYGASKHRVFVVPHVVDHERFLRGQTDLRLHSPERQPALHLNDDATVFLFAGKFIAKKRPMDFVRAIDRGRQEGARVTGVMVGDGPLRGECQQYVADRDLPIVFTGFLNQTEIAGAYAAADVLVLPSDGGETWGLVANEAMASGLPCIVSDRVGCGPDMVIAGETGDVYPLADVPVLGGLMARYARDPRAVAGMSQAAARMATRYTPRVATEATLTALAAVVDGAR